MRLISKTIAVSLLTVASVAAHASTDSFASPSFSDLVYKWPVLNTTAPDSFAALSAPQAFASSVATSIASITSAFQNALLNFENETNNLIRSLGGTPIPSGTVAVDLSGLQQPAAPSVPAITAPVPEPSTYAMMVAGLLGIAFVARRRGTRR